MPQLMPLMWMFSIFVILLIFIALVDLYYYKSEDISLFLEKHTSFVSNYKW